MIIASADLRVIFNPEVGGTITSITHLETGLSVLGTVPWPTINGPIASGAARDEPEWLTRYTGGWPLLFPNGGDACTVDGVFHGFHGEASITPWQAEASANTATLRRDFNTVPVTMHRTLTIVADTLTINETVHMTGDRPINVMWGHHPTFGSDLLAGPTLITTSGRRITVDDTYDPPANPLRPGSTSNWPMKSGHVDLSRPVAPMASLAYLEDFDEAWVTLRRIDNAIAAKLSWDAKLFPTAWLWFELEGTQEAPWNGQTRLIGIEPNTSKPAMGLAKARPLLRLEPGETRSTTLSLQVFRPRA